MTIILFLVDSSASMNQRTHFGARPTLLDVAKDAVEKFLKIRQRDAASRGDRYMLLSFEDPPANIKAGWKENHVTFMNELKNLTATGMTSLGSALKNAFDLLNLNRMQTGIDTYGQGRCPFFLEPSIIIVITDGGKLSNVAGVQERLNLPMHSAVPGSELTKEPFRWDQRLFSLVLRLTGTYNPPNDNYVAANHNVQVPFDNSPINSMCEVTGGRSFCVNSQRTLIASLEQLVQKIHGGVVINFEKVGPDPPAINPSDEKQILPNTNNVSNNGANNGNSNGHHLSSNGAFLNGPSMAAAPQQPYINGDISINSWQNIKNFIYVHPRSAQKGYSVGHWPLPEGFWPDTALPSLPPRTAHPVVKFTCNNSDPMIIDNLPFDKYELEPSPLTQYILSRKQPAVAWQVFVSNSHKSSELGLPFGYLKASTTLTCVNMFVLPYNYPVLLPLLEDLFKTHQKQPTLEWKMQFDAYFKNMPLYYVGPLKRALQRMGATPNLVPDNMDNYLSYSVLNYLKRLKNTAKAEFDKLVSMIGTVKPSVPEGTRIFNNSVSVKKMSEFGMNANNMPSHRIANLKNDLKDYQEFVIRISDKRSGSEGRAAQCYRNAFDIDRPELLDQIARMRRNFLQQHLSCIRYQDEDQEHSVPISLMGNYQEYLKRMPRGLRELESQPVRQHMFGNPFKIDRRDIAMIDETDIDLVGGSNNQSSMMNRKRSMTPEPVGPKPKRKPGPLPRDFSYPSSPRPYSPSSPNPYSPVNTPPPSPTPSPPPSLIEKKKVHPPVDKRTSINCNS